MILNSIQRLTFPDLDFTKYLSTPLDHNEPCYNPNSHFEIKQQSIAAIDSGY